MTATSRNQELRRRLDAVEKILPEVEDILRRIQTDENEDLGVRTKTNDMDLVTRADLESERIIKAAITGNFPDDAILAEESGRSGRDDAEFLWAIDPVDGTINYAHGLPLYCISVGILCENRPVAGIVSMPALRDHYRAVEGEGAFKNGHRIHVSATNDFSRALTVTGFPYDRERVMDDLLTGVRRVLERARGVRRTGSAALDLCWLAEGRFDAYYETNLNPWDTCAGTVILREAGGRMSDFNGNDHVPGDYQVAASNGLVHDALIETVRAIAHLQKQS